MNYKTLVLFILALGFAATVFASGSHDHGHTADKNASGDHSTHGASDSGDHAGMAVSEGMIIVGSQVSKGVKGMAHLSDVRQAMASAGMKATHHFMMAFVDIETGMQIEHGTVALKVIDPDGKVMDTVEMVGMDGHFGADVVLDKEGEYHFRLGTQLADGVNRKYHFHHIVK